MNLLKIKHVLLAADMPRALAFYAEALSLEPSVTSPWWSELVFGDSIIALHGGHDRAPNPTGLSLEFDSVLAAARRIEKAGGRIIEYPERRGNEPVLIGRVRDTEGNEFFITETVPAPTFENDPPQEEPQSPESAADGESKPA